MKKENRIDFSSSVNTIISLFFIYFGIVITTIKTISFLFREKLGNIYHEREIDTILFLMANKIMGFSKSDMILKKEEVIKESDALKFIKILEELLENKPVQYILGETEFYGLPFKVNEYVLIPRPETEELVKWMIEEIGTDQNLKKNNPVILDIGTGSGCIAIALKKNIPDSDIMGVDVSGEALQVAVENANRNKVEVLFRPMNILNKRYEDSPVKFDVIVSNPPYISVAEKESMAPNVIRYEPHSALFVEGDDVLLFYKRILEFAKRNLQAGGYVFFEIHEDHGEKLISYMEKENFSDVLLKKDINGKDRMIRCRFIN